MRVCPKCGNSWIANHAITQVLFRKHWYSAAQWVPFHEAYPNEPKYFCSQCGNKWGEWAEIRKGIVSASTVQEVREALDMNQRRLLECASKNEAR